MTKSPERVWVVMDANGYCEYVTDNETDAAAAQRELHPSFMHPGPVTIHEYRLHRPIQWRTGVPDAETKRRCEALFALRLPDGSVLRECVPQSDGEWWWGGGGAGEKFIDPEFLEVGWCPEDEMPEGEAT